MDTGCSGAEFDTFTAIALTFMRPEPGVGDSVASLMKFEVRNGPTIHAVNFRYTFGGEESGTGDQ